MKLFEDPREEAMARFALMALFTHAYLSNPNNAGVHLAIYEAEVVADMLLEKLELQLAEKTK